MKSLTIMLNKLILALAMIISCYASAEVGKVTHLSGELSAKNSSGETRQLNVKSSIDEGDLLISGKDSYARIKFIDAGNLIIRPNSEIKIDKYRFERKKPENDDVSVSLLKGSLRSITGLVGKRNNDRHRTTTANATIGIRGTHFGLLYCQSASDCASEQSLSGASPEAGLHIDVMQGQINTTNSAGSVNVQEGQFAYVQSDNSAPVIVDTENGVRVPVLPSLIDSSASDDDCI